MYQQFRIRETLNLSNCEDSSTDTKISYHVSHITCHLSPMSTATATDPSPSTPLIPPHYALHSVLVLVHQAEPNKKTASNRLGLAEFYPKTEGGGGEGKIVY